MDIAIKNARVHNLRGIDVTIPRDSLTVVTGLSGSGKSSLAFDTLYAEGQRRYVESLSAYARQFLDRMQKPDVEKIEGLSPAISIEQRTTSGNPRSIVATVTEIHDYLRILYGSIAVAHCPKCGKPVVKQSAEQIVESILGNQGGAAKIIIYAPLVKGKKGRHEETLAAVKRNGFARVRIDGTTYPIDELPELDKKKAHNIDVVIDRLVIPAEPDAAFRTRLTDSVELALKTGKGIMTVERLDSAEPKARGGERESEILSGAERKEPKARDAERQTTYSELNACPDCGISFDELKARSFSFNSPFGACPTCAGLGQLYYFDEDLVVPDKSLPLEEAIHPWRRMGQMNILYHKELLAHIAKQYKVKLSTPYEKLPAKFRNGLMHGFKDDLVLPWRRVDRPFEGVLASLQRRLDEAEDDEMRAKFEAYQSFRTCPDCHGSRLRPESRAATVMGKSIVEVMAMPVTEALEFFKKFAAGASRPSLVVRGRVGDASLPGELICRILELDGCKTGAFFFGMSEENLDKILSRPWIVPGSDASLRAPWGPLGADHPHPRAYGTMPEFYRRVRALGVSREEAIARMTSVPARRFGIAHRGVIEKGAFADLAIWKEGEFASKATYVEPHQFSRGVKAVVVNGAVSYADGKFSADRTGRFLERKQ